MKLIKHSIILILLTGSASLFAQNVDSLFSEARTTAFRGNRELAREMCREILKENPDYHGVRVFLARVYAWDQMYDEALDELAYILGKKNKNKEALVARTEFLVWAERYDDAIKSADNALEVLPGNKNLLFNKAVALSESENEKKAMIIIRDLEKRYPEDKNIYSLKIQTLNKLRKYYAAASFTNEAYEDYYTPARLYNIELGYRTDFLTTIAGINYLQRFKTDALQTELKFYPVFSKRVYGLLHYAYSAKELYPQHLFSGELYVGGLPYSTELSAGYRHYIFQDKSSVDIISTSLNWYYRSFLSTVRLFLSPHDGDLTTSFNAAVRWYYSGEEDYLVLRAGAGFTPEYKILPTAGQEVLKESVLLNNQNLGVDWQLLLSYDYLLRLSFAFVNQELAFNPGEYTFIYRAGAGVQVRF